MVLFYVLLAFCFSLFFGILYQWLASRADAKRFPAPGQFVVIQGPVCQMNHYSTNLGDIYD